MPAERWAEISTLDGESVLLIMERTDPDERPDVLSETPIAVDPEQDTAYVDVAAELAALGYREVGERVYTDYGCALGIAALRPGGPGRPEVGRPINIRLGDELLAKVDAKAQSAGIARAELIRRIVAAAMER